MVNIRNKLRQADNKGILDPSTAKAVNYFNNLSPIERYRLRQEVSSDSKTVSGQYNAIIKYLKKRV